MTTTIEIKHWSVQLQHEGFWFSFCIGQSEQAARRAFLDHRFDASTQAARLIADKQIVSTWAR